MIEDLFEATDIWVERAEGKVEKVKSAPPSRKTHGRRLG